MFIGVEAFFISIHYQVQNSRFLSNLYPFNNAEKNVNVYHAMLLNVAISMTLPNIKICSIFERRCSLLNDKHSTIQCLLFNKLNLLNGEIRPSFILSVNNIQHVKLWPIAIFSTRFGTIFITF